MALCNNCGSQLPEGAAFCANCGTPVDNAQQPQQAQQTYQDPQQVYQQPQQGYADPQQGYQQPQQGYADHQQGYQYPAPNTDGRPLGAEKGLAWLSYILWGPAFLIPLFVKKTSEYCKFHVKQGATLWAVHIVYWTITSIFLAVIDAATATRWYGVVVEHSAVYTVFNILFAGGTVFLAVLAIIGIVNAATGKKKELPLISKIPWAAMLIDKLYAAINK